MRFLPSAATAVPGLLAAALALAACATNRDTGRTALITISAKKELEMGDMLYRALRTQKKTAAGTTAASRVQRVGRRLTRDLTAPYVRWRFLVIRGDEFNAFTLPSGTIAIYQGLVDALATDELLAAVLSHEIAHAMLRHPVEKISPAYAGAKIGQAITAPLHILLPKGEPKRVEHITNLESRGFLDLLDNPVNRQRELEADAEGMRIMAKAGYAPETIIAFWRFMDTTEPKHSFHRAAFLSSHPGGAARAKFLTARLPEARQLYLAARRR